MSLPRDPFGSGDTTKARMDVILQWMALVFWFSVVLSVTEEPFLLFIFTSVA
jgi:hypothetical protein